MPLLVVVVLTITGTGASDGCSRMSSNWPNITTAVPVVYLDVSVYALVSACVCVCVCVFVSVLALMTCAVVHEDVHSDKLLKQLIQ